MASVRNEKLDIIRGIAAFLVISGHTMQVYNGYTDNPLYNFITSIQMPLFMMVSGYAIGYSAVIDGMKSFVGFLRKRTITLMIPWLVWSILAYLILSNKPVWEYIKSTAYHMEAAFWFLFSLWCIHIIFAVSSLLSNKLRLSKGGRIAVLLLACGVLDAILLIIGSKIGMKFLGIKYTTYYLLFYLIGWLLQKADTKFPEWICNKIGAISFVVLSVFFASDVIKSLNCIIA